MMRFNKEKAVRAIVRKLAIPASKAVMTARLDGDPLSSAFGTIRASARGERWPERFGIAMWPLCQINCTELPVTPRPLEGVAMLRVWVLPEYAETWGPEAVCIRASASLSSMRGAKEPHVGSTLQPKGVRWARFMDSPTVYDLPRSVHEEVVQVLSQRSCMAYEFTKVGGYPFEVQGTGPYRVLGGEEFGERMYDYVLQIGSETKARWMWGDSGVAWVARSRSRRNQWDFAWESH